MTTQQPPDWISDSDWQERAIASHDRSRDAIHATLTSCGVTRLQASRCVMAIMSDLRGLTGLVGERPIVRSPIEAIIWLELIGPVFQRDLIIHYEPEDYTPYTPDFALRARSDEPPLIIELDGHDFHQKTREQVEHDKRRDRWFAAKGLHVLRFTGSEVWRDASAVVAEILAFFDQEVDA